MRRLLAAALALAAACPALAAPSSKIPASSLIESAALVARLKDGAKPAPLLIHVGFEPLFKLSHIPGSEYFGPASKPEALAKLKQRLKGVPRGREIVIYCGCCPWPHCPNIEPAFAALKALGFKNVKALKLPRSFGQDWAEAGLPTVKAG